MNSSMTELDTTQNKEEYLDTEHSSKDCGSEKVSNVYYEPAGAPVWAGSPSDVSPLPDQHTIQPGMVDPLTLRLHCSYQSSQCQLTYPDYLLEPQSRQYHLLTGSVPGPPDCSHLSSLSAPWFTNDPIHYSMMQGDFHVPLPSIPQYVPQAMDHQQFQEGLTDVTSHITQPLSQYHQKACFLYEPRDETANMQPLAHPAGTAAAMCESKSRKPCHCTRSQCLKLYCECFANGVMCNSCDCSNCHNNAEHEMTRRKAIESCLGRKPDAFKSKITGRKSGEVKGWHNKGCHCKRSGCLKNYCECYEANIMCTASCKCVGCGNYDVSSEKGLKEKTVNDKNKCAVITPAVVEAVRGCLLTKAEEAERERQSHIQAEHTLLGEFGECLTKIVKVMFKNSP